MRPVLQPPTRYTEATLVQAMERAGIGRPSTYAQTLATLQQRAYAVLLGKHLAVTAVGLLVTAYLGQQVPDVLAREFTATMEAGLDEVARGETTRVAYLTRFWKEGLALAVDGARKHAPELPLPHLPGVALHAGLQGPGLTVEGRRVPLPGTALPAELTPQDLPALLSGTWMPNTTGKRRPATRTPAPGSSAPARGEPRRSRTEKSTATGSGARAQRKRRERTSDGPSPPRRAGKRRRPT